MRIISGQFRGRKLQTFKGSDVRPTSDRVRESLFNIIAHKPVNVSVLDLFSGTGALGIEALSRGAEMAVFVDRSVRALALLRKNLDHCALHRRTRAIQWDIAKNLNCLQIYPNTFNLVFLDPPYNKGFIPLAMHHLLQSRCLAAGALLVAEHEAQAQPAVGAMQYTIIDNRRYGRTGLSFYAYSPV